MSMSIFGHSFIIAIIFPGVILSVVLIIGLCRAGAMSSRYDEHLKESFERERNEKNY